MACQGAGHALIQLAMQTLNPKHGFSPAQDGQPNTPNMCTAQDKLARGPVHAHPGSSDQPASPLEFYLHALSLFSKRLQARALAETV